MSGAQVVLDPSSEASLGARGVASPDLRANTNIKDASLIAAGLDPVYTKGPPNAVGAASLDISFMNPGTLPANVVFARASVGTYFDINGVLQTATTNVPRWDYDPVSHVLHGVLMETARTNLLLNSASLGTQGVAVTAQAYMLSFYGTGTVTLSGVSTAGPLVGTGLFPQRVSLAFTPTAGTLTLTVTGSVLNAQLEAGTTASSWIPTTGTTVARAVEHCTLTDAVLFGGTTDRTLAIEAWSQQAVLISHMGSVDDNSGNNYMRLFAGGLPGIRTAIVAGGVVQINGGDVTPGTRPLIVKAAVANSSIWNGAVNGVPMATTGGPSSQLGPLTTLHCGEAYNASQQMDGAIQRIRYWRSALSPLVLQQVTT